MAKVYVSSTFIDLRECRRKVSLILRQMGFEDVAMEYYVAGNERPVDKCLNDVAACDLYVGIFAWRYGFIPKKNNSKKLSWRINYTCNRSDWPELALSRCTCKLVDGT
ncbi:MAG TPA: DUF4062 domain-containing protein [Pyrinomonadaceae bacterium]|nr:DUF4062 domain-containing protein [Pyrinomonadaceae bacterium]